MAFFVCVCVLSAVLHTKKKKVRERDPQQLPRRWSATTPRSGHSLPVKSRRRRLRCFKTRSRYCLRSARITTPSARKDFPSLTELRTPHAALNIVAAPPAANGREGEGTEGAGPETPRWAPAAGDWWLAVHRWRICVFSKITLHCCLQ